MATTPEADGTPPAEPIDEWVAAGVYDPTAPDADDQLALLRYTSGFGLSLDEIATRHRAGTLSRGPVDEVLRVERTLGRAEAATRAGMTPEQLDRAWLAIGLPLVAEGEPAFNERDVAMLNAFAVGGELLGFDGIVQLARVLGTSMARVADASIVAFLANVERPLMSEGAGRADRAKTSVEAAQMLAGLPVVFDTLFLRHVEAAVDRTRATQEPDQFDTFRLTVGFLDLVGYTAWSQSLPLDQLAAAVERFEQTANDRITANGGRVVKNIGDAVMFVAADPSDAARVALDLCRFVAADPVLTDLRAAIATGELLGRDGDYYGATVNLAARAVKAAEPGGLVADGPVAGFDHVPLDPMALHGIDGAVVLHRIIGLGPS